MGMKLKSGADLCGFELRNFCIQAETSAPSDAGIGRKYLHTNATDDVATGISLLNRERIYIGESTWRATAYLDDIAAINEKLNLITGDTDTDTLINNLKDLEEFLKDFSETDKLKSLLDGKLDKSGGTITSSNGNPLLINSTGSQVGVVWRKSGTNKGWVGYDSLGFSIYNYVADVSLGIKDDGTPFIGSNTLIHSGNIGSYAFLKTATKLTSSDTLDADLIGLYSYQDTNNPTNNFGNNAALLSFKGTKANPTFQLAFAGNEGTIGYKVKLANGTWQPWKTIAFTDSNVASAQALTHSNGTIGAVVNSSGNVTIGGTTTDSGEKLQIHAPTWDSLAINRTASGSGASIVIYSNGTKIGRFGINGSKMFEVGNTSDTRFWVDVTTGKTTIGATSHQSSYMLYVNGNSHIQGALGVSGAVTISKDVHIQGNLIVDGEVSAGGAGAEEDTSGGGGSVDFHSEDFTPSTSTTYQVNHNLGKKVIVQVYEQGTTSETWNLVMVDVEIISATRLDLRFGKTETTPHRVVVMGAGV